MCPALCVQGRQYVKGDFVLRVGTATFTGGSSHQSMAVGHVIEVRGGARVICNEGAQSTTPSDNGSCY